MSSVMFVSLFVFVSVHLYVCPVRTPTFRCLDLKTSFWYADTSSENLGQGRVWRSSGQGRWHDTHSRWWSVLDQKAIMLLILSVFAWPVNTRIMSCLVKDSQQLFITCGSEFFRVRTTNVLLTGSRQWRKCTENLENVRFFL